MKDDIRNIINLDNLTRVRSSLNATNNTPAKNSIVKLIPIQYLKQGVKVLIDGKLFIAFIEGKIPIKEEIIAQVTNDVPFSLCLNLNAQYTKNAQFVIDQIIKKFELPNSDIIRQTIIKVIEEDHILLKSKIIQLSEFIKNIKVEGLELSLLINLVWNNSSKGNKFIEDLYDTLFDESFEKVCENIFSSINELLFSSVPQFVRQQINETLIYCEENSNPKVISNKIESIYSLIKLLNEHKNDSMSWDDSLITKFITYGTKYILQKSVLKEYDYYPDFVIVNQASELTIIHYSIKKIFSTEQKVSYKIIFKHQALPFELSGIIRDNFFSGAIEVDDELVNENEVKSFEENLFNHWGFRSDISINNRQNKDYYISKINTEVNKLVS